MIDPELREFAVSLITKTPDKSMKLSNGKYALDLSVDEDTYWGLVKLGAEIQTDHETYAENILIGCVQSELNRQATDRMD